MHRLLTNCKSVCAMLSFPTLQHRINTRQKNPARKHCKISIMSFVHCHVICECVTDRYDKKKKTSQNALKLELSKLSNIHHFKDSAKLLRGIEY